MTRLATNCTLGALFCSALVACAIPPPEESQTQTLELTRLSNGNLGYCDENGDCRELPYGGECAVVTIIIDTVSGQTCETCTMDDGTVIDNGCERASVQCVVWEVPDPDCVVCAYVNGDIIYSSCVPPDGDPGCRDDSQCGPGEVCMNAVCVPSSRDCVSDADCPAGTVCIFDCPWDAAGNAERPCMDPGCGCGGTCQPANDPCATVLCAPGSHCEVQEVQCFAYPCEPQPVCVPDARECSSDADCPRGFVCDNGCPDGTAQRPACDATIDPDCMPPCGPGTCVPSPEGCTDDSQCASGEQCVIACADCAPDAGIPCGGCYGWCEPIYNDPCAAYDCGPGYHCEPQYVDCFAYPCDPIPECVPDPVSCLSDADCPDGLVCQSTCDAAGNATDIACTPDYCPPCGGICVPPPPPGCQSDADCGRGEQCTFYCWDCMAGDTNCIGGCQGVCEPVYVDPCAAYDCAPGYHCEAQYVQCFAFPCDPIPVCVEDPVACTTDSDCPDGLVCSPSCDPATGMGMPCSPDYCPPCGGICVPPPPPSCQSNADCAAGEECVTLCWDCMPGDASCIGGCAGQCWPVPTDPCATVLCAEGTHCELQDVQCFAFPCDPVPVCVADAPTCETDADCASDQHCELLACTQCADPTGADTTNCPHCWGTCAPNPVDCHRSGCSGQICSDTDVDTTCEWRDEYACYDAAACERQADGACGWTMTLELRQCLASSVGGLPNTP